MKYELTEEIKVVDGVTLHRIRALRNIRYYEIKAGDLGGWVQSEDNLSQGGDCWVTDAAHVDGDARIEDDALIADNAMISGNAQIVGHAIVDSCACVCGNTHVSGSALIDGHAFIGGDTWIRGNAVVCGHACVIGVNNIIEIVDNVRIFGDAWIFSNNHYAYIPLGIYGNATIYILRNGNVEASHGGRISTVDQLCADIINTYGDSIATQKYTEIIRKAAIQLGG